MQAECRQLLGVNTAAWLCYIPDADVNFNSMRKLGQKDGKSGIVSVLYSFLATFITAVATTVKFKSLFFTLQTLLVVQSEESKGTSAPNNPQVAVCSFPPSIFFRFLHHVAWV